MKKFLTILATGSLLMAAFANTAFAQDDGAETVVPVHLYACTYNDGMGPEELDTATAKWNAWADGAGMDDYSAWTLAKYYYGPLQAFDVIWLGVAPNGTAMGRVEDQYLATGGAAAMGFAKVVTCGAHNRFAAMEFKAPPSGDTEPTVMLAFQDCKIAEGKNFNDDVAPAVRKWADFRTDQDSIGGQWVLFPAYGGGGEEFDFKWVSSYANHEAMGQSWDSYDGELDSKLFDGVIDCDSSRVYNATNRRAAETD